MYFGSGCLARTLRMRIHNTPSTTMPQMIAATIYKKSLFF